MIKKNSNNAANTAATTTPATAESESNVCFITLSPSEKQKKVLAILNKYYIIKRNSVTHRVDFREKTKEEIELAEAYKESMAENATKVLPKYKGQTLLDETIELKPVIDEDFYSMRNKIIEEDINYNLTDLKCLIESDKFPKYNPLQDYLNGLPQYDGKNYIAQLAACVKMDATDNFSFFLRIIIKWLVSMVASIMEVDKCNEIVLILCGRQGIGKSTFFANVMPEKLRKIYFTAKEIDMSNKDDQLLLSTMWLICMDELANMQKKSVKKFKEFLTKIDITLRQPYAHFNESYTRNCSFCGTSNDIHILFDNTGNRRFAPFEITDIDLEALKEVNIDMVFAQAMSLYRSGFQYWIEKGPEQDELERHNKRFLNQDPEEQLLLELYEPCEPNDPNAKSMKVSAIVEEICNKTGHLISQTKFGEFAKTMDRLGFKVAKKSHGYTYRCVKERPQTDAE